MQPSLMPLQPGPNFAMLDMTGKPNTVPFQIQTQTYFNDAYVVYLYVSHLILEYDSKFAV